MSKRAPQFERRPRDFYPTPESAVIPLLAHLPTGTVFNEPCVGDGALVRHLKKNGHICGSSFDIKPAMAGLARGDATCEWVWPGADFNITNPPWARPVLHQIITNLSKQLPTWLLFDADWMHTRQAAPYLPLLRKIVSVGRVKWIPDSPHTGKDNCCWYLFDAHGDAPAQFIGRAS